MKRLVIWSASGLVRARLTVLDDGIRVVIEYTTAQPNKGPMLIDDAVVYLPLHVVRDKVYEVMQAT